MGLVYQIRDFFRMNPFTAGAVLLVQGLTASYFGRLVSFQRSQRDVPPGEGLTLCLRFRNEARYLAEWLEYHHVAGVEHFFLYNNNSNDNYLEVLTPYIERGWVTLIDWPRSPASPAAEEDCIKRTRGKYAWVGFIDADEFVIIKDFRSIGEFLTDYPDAAAVVLHWRFFGSSGHDRRPQTAVIDAYRECEDKYNGHVKTILRPERAAQCRNSHSWFYTPWTLAMNEARKRSFGSHLPNPVGDKIWLNHYYSKSREDYMEKMARKSTLDKIGIRFPSRTEEKIKIAMEEYREAKDDSAVVYYKHRCEVLGQEPILLKPVHADSVAK